MTDWTALALGLLIITSISHIVSIGIMMGRCRIPLTPNIAPQKQPPVTIIRPLRGLESFIETTLESSFNLDYPDYELIFCVADAHDPVVAIVEHLIERHLDKRAILIIGDESISKSPKLNNCAKGWAAASHDWIVFADSNVLLPSDYLNRLIASWRPDTGLVSCPPAGFQPLNFWANVECAFLNTYQARWQYFADSIGIGFAQGKNLMWRRDTLEDIGGIRALGSESSDDAASTKLARAAGLRVRLVNAPFALPLGTRSARDVWRRQARWARIRRTSFPIIFALELFTSALWPIIACGWLASQNNFSIFGSIMAFMLIWYGLEIILAGIAGWPLFLTYPLHAAARDLTLPILWISGWIQRTHTWRDWRLQF